MQLSTSPSTMKCTVAADSPRPRDHKFDKDTHFVDGGLECFHIKERI